VNACDECVCVRVSMLLLMILQVQRKRKQPDGTSEADNSHNPDDNGAAPPPPRPTSMRIKNPPERFDKYQADALGYQKITVDGQDLVTHKQKPASAPTKKVARTSNSKDEWEIEAITGVSVEHNDRVCHITECLETRGKAEYFAEVRWKGRANQQAHWDKKQHWSHVKNTDEAKSWGIATAEDRLERHKQETAGALNGADRLT
jgi:hypothetical protein